MQIVRNKTTLLVQYVFEDYETVTLDAHGLKSANIHALDIKPATHDLVQGVPAPDLFIGNALKYDGGWIVVDAEAIAAKLEELKTEKLEIVATARRKALDDGFMHNGILWDSDANARIAYAELAMRYQYDPAFVTTWKASDGYWVEMTAPLFQAVYAAGAEHVQTCFAWQAAKEVEIKACQTVEELEAVVVTI